MANGDDVIPGLPGEVPTPFKSEYEKKKRELEEQKEKHTPSPAEILSKRTKEDPPSGDPADDKEDAGTHFLNKFYESMQAQQEDRRKMQEELIPLHKAINEQIRSAIANRPQMPQVPTQAPIPQEDRRAMGRALWGYTAVALPLAILFGARGGAFAMGAIGGFGQGISELVKGQQDNYQLAMNRANAINQQLGVNYERQMNSYKEILANDRLTTDEMMKQVENVASIWGDKLLADEAREKSFDKVITHMEKKQKALDDYKEKWRTHQDKLLTSDFKNYLDAFYQENGFYPDPSDKTLTAEQLKTIKDNSFAKWLAEHEKGKKKADALAPTSSDDPYNLGDVK